MCTAVGPLVDTTPGIMGMSGHIIGTTHRECATDTTTTVTMDHARTTIGHMPMNGRITDRPIEEGIRLAGDIRRASLLRIFIAK